MRCGVGRRSMQIAHHVCFGSLIWHNKRWLGLFSSLPLIGIPVTPPEEQRLIHSLSNTLLLCHRVDRQLGTTRQQITKAKVPHCWSFYVISVWNIIALRSQGNLLWPIQQQLFEKYNTFELHTKYIESIYNVGSGYDMPFMLCTVWHKTWHRCFILLYSKYPDS